MTDPERSIPPVKLYDFGNQRLAVSSAISGRFILDVESFPENLEEANPTVLARAKFIYNVREHLELHPRSLICGVSFDGHDTDPRKKLRDSVLTRLSESPQSVLVWDVSSGVIKNAIAGRESLLIIEGFYNLQGESLKQVRKFIKKLQFNRVIYEYGPGENIVPPNS